jgi:5-formyltetrahydrofolate cyclo-ligase
MTEETKRDLRLHRLAARRAMSAEQREDQDSRVRECLRVLINERKPRTVAAYVPLSGEPGGSHLADFLAPQVERLLLPVLLEDYDLDWAVYTGILEPASRGLVEPDGPRLGVGAVGEAELVIVPGLAIAVDGTRLGRGGGSYDRALARVHSPALSVTPLYEGELVDRLPTEPHDQRVDGAVTPTGLVLFPA